MPMTPLDIILILNSSLALQFMVNNKFSSLSTWFEQNLLSINNTKSQAMIPGSATHKWDLFINGMKVEVKSTLKILGVTLDRKISNNETYFGKVTQNLLQDLSSYNEYLSL